MPRESMFKRYVGVLFFFSASVCAFSQPQADSLAIRMLLIVGDSLYRVGNYTEAASRYEQATGLLEQSRAWAPALDGLEKQGYCLLALGNSGELQKLAEYALAIGHGNMNTGWLKQEIFLNFLSEACRLNHDFETSTAWQEKRLSFLRLNHPEEKNHIADAYCFLGKNLMDTGKAHEALNAYGNALKIIEAANPEMEKVWATAMNGLGIVNKELGRYNDALYFYTLALDYARKKGQKREMAFTLYNMGFAEFLKNNNEAALDNFLKSESLILELFGSRHYLLAVIYRVC